jgi:hypothetical protein
MKELKDKLIALLVTQVPEVLVRAEIMALVAAIEKGARDEVNGSWHRTLGDALNSGDGAYRP